MAGFRADMHRRPEMLPPLATDLLVLPEDSWPLYFLTRRAYCAPLSDVEARMRERQSFIASWHDVELFCLWISDRAVCYCKILTWWRQYHISALIFVLRPPVLSYYIRLVLNGFRDDNSCLSKFSVAEFAFLTGVMLVINAADGSCASYYSRSPRFDHVRGSILFRLPVKILDAIRYFGLYKFARRIGTAPVLAVILFHRCFEVKWEKTVLRDGYVSYDFRTGDVYGIEDETKPASKRIRGDDGANSSNLLHVVSLPFRDGVEWTSLEANRRDYHKHRGQTEGSGDVNGRAEEKG